MTPTSYQKINIYLNKTLRAFLYFRVTCLLVKLGLSEASSAEPLTRTQEKCRLSCVLYKANSRQRFKLRLVPLVLSLPI